MRNRLLSNVFFVIALLLMCGSQAIGSQQNSSLQALSFMQGVWVGKSKTSAFVEEYWSNPEGDSMIGHCRFQKNGITTFYELMAIVKSPKGIVLRMRHFNDQFKGWAESEESGDCYLRTCRNQQAVFDNKNEKNRVIVTYKKVGPDTMHVEVESTQNGKTSKYPFEYKRRI